jgi:hypothetical protein
MVGILSPTPIPKDIPKMNAYILPAKLHVSVSADAIAHEAASVILVEADEFFRE